jgi:glycosyltransferase involved in cell wall biosynthesis
MKPKVSIGLPTRNGEQYLNEALHSLLRQTMSDFEIIVCDNASDDRTAEIARDIASTDRRVRYIRSDVDIGCSANHNRTFSLANGEYFHWHGDDDLCAPNYLESCVAVLERDQSIVLCHSQTCPINSTGEPLRYDPDFGALIDTERTFLIPLPDGNYADHADPVVRFREALWKTAGCQHVMGVMRAAAARRTRLLSSYYSADRAFLMSMALLGRFHLIPEQLFFKREHGGNSRYLGSPEAKARFAAPTIPAWLGRFDHLRGYIEITRAVLTSELKFPDKRECLGIALHKAIGTRARRYPAPNLSVGAE